MKRTRRKKNVYFKVWTQIYGLKYIIFCGMYFTTAREEWALNVDICEAFSVICLIEHANTSKTCCLLLLYQSPL